jgi:Domain of unknown function (DUF4124)
MNRQWLRLLCACTLGLSTLPAHAQYSWIDEKGARVFSDRPPPPGTPPGRILKMPRGMEPASAPAAAPADADAGTPDWKRREADYRERSAKREKEEREAEAKRRQDHDAECVWARGAQKQLANARRLEWKNKKGEPEFISDEDRAREQERVQRILSRCN